MRHYIHFRTSNPEPNYEDGSVIFLITKGEPLSDVQAVVEANTIKECLHVLNRYWHSFECARLITWQTDYDENELPETLKKPNCSEGRSIQSLMINIDRQVAQVLGTIREHEWINTGLCSHDASLYRCPHCGTLDLTDLPGYGQTEECVPPYSTDLNFAIEAAEQAAVREFGEMTLSPCIDLYQREWTCQIGDSTERAFADTPARAICKAILKLAY